MIVYPRYSLIRYALFEHSISTLAKSDGLVVSLCRQHYVHGVTDEFSHHAVEGIVHHFDWLATVLNQFGLRHAEMNFRIGPRAIKLVEQEQAKVVEDLLA